MHGHRVMAMDFLPSYFTISRKIGTSVCAFFIQHFFPLADQVTEEVLIDFREIIGEHSSENLAHAIWETLELYGLKGRVSVLSFNPPLPH